MYPVSASKQKSDFLSEKKKKNINEKYASFTVSFKMNDDNLKSYIQLVKKKWVECEDGQFL